MKKKILIVAIFFVAISFNFMTVRADYCTDCAEKGTPCGMCGYGCAVVDGVCVTNKNMVSNDDACTVCAEKGTPCGMCGYGCAVVDGVCVTNDNMTSNDNNTNNNQYNNFSDDYKSCGGILDNIPALLPKLVSVAYTIIQIAVPIVLVILGTLDLMKGIMAQKEDEIKKGQTVFIKRLIAAAIVFFVFAISKFVISFVSNDRGILDCAECFIKNDCN